MSAHTIELKDENKKLVREYLSRFTGQMTIEFGINKIISEWGIYQQITKTKTVKCSVQLRKDFTVGEEYICFAELKNVGMKSGVGLVVIDNFGEQRMVCSSYFK